MDIVGFYKENAEKAGEDVWDKFDHAKIPELRIKTPAPAPLSPGLHNTANYGSLASPPASPRFPANHETSFENPRSPPPVPRGNASPMFQQKDINGLMPNRPAPRPPVAQPGRVAPPPPQGAKDSGIGLARKSEDLPALAYVPPTVTDNTPMLPEEVRDLNRSRSNSRANGPAPYTPSPVQSPPVPQQATFPEPQQQYALGRMPSNRLPPQSVSTPQNQYTQPDGKAVPHPSHSVRQAPGPRPRQRPRQSTGIDVVARLKQICTQGDPRTIYRGLNKIGQGASGGVFTGYEQGTNRLVAIKQMNLEQQPKKDLIINEILVMKDSSHPNIVNFIDSFLISGELWVIMEFMEGGSLTDVVTICSSIFA